MCSKSQAITSYLFGDKLPKHIKEIGQVNKISRRLASRPLSSSSIYGGKPYKSSGPYPGSNKKPFLGYRGRVNSVHVQISMDNSTAVSYINNMGGTKSHSLDTLSRCLWEWRISRQLHVSAQHVPGASNIRADQLSRIIDCHLEWSLNNEVYKSNICQIGFTHELDLFASILNAKTDNFVSWHPEPGAVAYDAFAIS